MKQYQVSYEVLVDIEADNKGHALARANDELANNAQEYGVLSQMACESVVDPISVHELDEHGDPII